MYRIEITPAAKSKQPRIEFARNDKEMADIVATWWKKSPHVRIKVFTDVAESVASFMARERNGYVEQKTKAKLA